LAAEGVRCLAVDLPGFGASAAEPGPYTMEGLADALARMLDAQGIAKIALVGGSMGGVVAQHFVLRHPARVERLLLVATGAYTADPAGALAKADVVEAAAWDEETVAPMVKGFFRQPPSESQQKRYCSIALAASQQAAAAAGQKKAPGTQANGAGAKPVAGKRTAAENKRLKELQARIDEQQKQLKDTQDQVAKNRADLEGNVNSTRDELTGSIAKTHEELVALAKRGERSYFEFDLTKSKQFQRVGPLTLALRRTDTKHKNFNLDMIVDDNRLSKKNVNLYEPIWIHTENDAQPVQVVVNRVEKNLVHGYVSAPKYKPSELAVSSSTNTATVTPVAAHPQTPDQNPQSPKQPE